MLSEREVGSYNKAKNPPCVLPDKRENAVSFCNNILDILWA